MVFCSFGPVEKDDQRCKLFWSKNYRGRQTFGSIGVFSIYGKNSIYAYFLYAYSPCTKTFGDCIIEISHKTLIFSVTIKFLA
jgi:hypothetical protein